MMITGMIIMGTANTFGKTTTIGHNNKNHKHHTEVVTIVRDRHNKQVTGGYTKQRNLTREDKILFKNTYRGKDKLTPVSVATQVVNGTNYEFICKDKRGRIVTVTIYKSLPYQGCKSRIVSIHR